MYSETYSKLGSMGSRALQAATMASLSLSLAAGVHQASKPGDSVQEAAIGWDRPSITDSQAGWRPDEASRQASPAGRRYSLEASLQEAIQESPEILGSGLPRARREKLPQPTRTRTAPAPEPSPAAPEAGIAAPAKPAAPAMPAPGKPSIPPADWRDAVSGMAAGGAFGGVPFRGFSHPSASSGSKSLKLAALNAMPAGSVAFKDSGLKAVAKSPASASRAMGQLRKASSLSVAGKRSAAPEQSSARETAAFEQSVADGSGVRTSVQDGAGLSSEGAVFPFSPGGTAPREADSGAATVQPEEARPFNATPYQKKLDDAKKKIQDAKKLKMLGMALIGLGAGLIGLGLFTIMRGKMKLRESKQKDAEAQEKEQMAQFCRADAKAAKAMAASYRAMVPPNEAAAQACDTEAIEAESMADKNQAEADRLKAEAAKLKAEGNALVGAGTGLVVVGGILVAAGIALIMMANDKANSAKKDADDIQRKWKQDQQAQIVRDRADRAVQ